MGEKMGEKMGNASSSSSERTKHGQRNNNGTRASECVDTTRLETVLEPLLDPSACTTANENLDPSIGTLSANDLLLTKSQSPGSFAVPMIFVTGDCATL